MQNRNFFIGVIAVVMVVSVFFMVRRSEMFYGNRTPAHLQTDNSQIDNSQVAIAQERELMLARQQKEIENLIVQLNECENRTLAASNSGMNSGTNSGTNSGQLSITGPIEMQVSGDMKVSGKLTLTPVGPASQPVVKRVAQAPRAKTPAPKVVAQSTTRKAVVEQVPSSASAAQRTVTRNKTLPTYYYDNPGDDKVSLCFRFGKSESRHLPALNPESFDKEIIKPNNLPGGGTNFYVYPSSGLIGDLGVTEDGEIYASEELIKTFMISSDNGIVEVKAPATGWVPKELLYNGDGYYIWSPK